MLLNHIVVEGDFNALQFSFILFSNNLKKDFVEVGVVEVWGQRADKDGALVLLSLESFDVLIEGENSDLTGGRRVPLEEAHFFADFVAVFLAIELNNGGPGALQVLSSDLGWIVGVDVNTSGILDFVFDLDSGDTVGR